MTIRNVAAYLKLGWDLGKDIQKEYLRKRFDKPKIHQRKQIAIDEIYLGSDRSSPRGYPGV